MKKRTAFIGAILSLIPLGQPSLIGMGAAFISSAAIHSLSAKAETNNANSFYKKGLKKYDQNDLKGALAEFTKAIKINPEYGDAYYNRGLVKKELLDIQGAIEDYTKAIKINPNDGRAYYDRAILKEGRRDFQGAIEDYKKAINIDPNNGRAFYNRAILYSSYNKAILKKGQKRDIKGAIKDYMKLIKINPNDVLAYYYRAILKEGQTDIKGAIGDYTKVIKINPEYGDAYYNRALLKQELQDNKGAIEDYTKAIKINPENADAYFNRSKAKDELEDYESAFLDMKRSLEISSKGKDGISIKDIIHPSMLKKRSEILKGYRRFAGFDGNTYQKPITYYIHDQTGKIRSKLLPKKMQDTYEISDDAEKFIVDIFSKIDSYIDLDFMRVDSPSKAMIKIFKTNEWDGYTGMMSYDTRPNLRIDLAWSEGFSYNQLKMKKYPTLSVDGASIIVHEIGHALGLEHSGCGQYCKFNMDPEDERFTTEDTIMSYNFNPSQEDSYLTELDIVALRIMWGVEKDN